MGNFADLSLTSQEIRNDANAGLAFLIGCRCKITVQSTLKPQLQSGLIVSNSVISAVIGGDEQGG